MKIVCVKCQRSLKPEKNGVTVEEMMDQDLKKPYKLWEADKWKCPICGIEIISGFGMNAWAEHYQKDYKKYRKEAELKFY